MIVTVEGVKERLELEESTSALPDASSSIHPSQSSRRRKGACANRHPADARYRSLWQGLSSCLQSMTSCPVGSHSWYVTCVTRHVEAELLARLWKDTQPRSQHWTSPSHMARLLALHKETRNPAYGTCSLEKRLGACEDTMTLSNAFKSRRVCVLQEVKTEACVSGTSQRSKMRMTGRRKCTIYPKSRRRLTRWAAA